MQKRFFRTDAAEDAKKRAQQQFMREQEARDRQQLESRRWLCTFLRFWRVCADRRCMRARQCAGDVEACFNRFWPHVPEDIKNQIRQTIKFMNDGMPPHQAAVAAIEYVAQRRRIEEETKARAAACAVAPPPAAPAPVPITRVRAAAHRVGPRVRGV
jgi:glycosidase